MSSLPVKAKPLQVCIDDVLQFRGLGELGVQFRDEALHRFLNR